MKPMPAPIAVALAQYQAEPHPFQKLHRLVDTYETLLKYTGALAIQNFNAAELAGAFPETDQLIRDRITRPMLGDWAGFVREVLRCFAALEAELFSRELFLFHFKRFAARPDLQKHFSDQGASGRLLALRNRLAHGATLPDEESNALIEQHKTDLLTLLEKASFLADLPLFFVESQTSDAEFSAVSLMGAEPDNPAPALLAAESLPVNQVVVHNPVTNAFLDLHPLLLYTECEEEVAEWDAGHRRIIGKAVCHQRKALFYNDLKAEDRIGFLDYWRGHNSRFKPPSSLPQEFRERFPKPERAAQRANWFEAFIREWTTHFVGREREQETMDRFVTDSSKRVLVVIAVPGMGKSALLAKWADEHKAARHFIREGDAITYETERVFENLGLQLSERFGVEWKNPTTPELIAYRRAFEETLNAAAENAQGRIVLVVDGLDEATRALARGRGMETTQTILDYLSDPAGLPARVRLILSTRPELLDHSSFAAKFGQDKAEHLELGRLTDMDVRALLYQVRSKYEVLESGEYVDAIVERSAGSPLYLRMLLEDLSEGHLTFGQIKLLPRGVAAYFERILEFIESEGRTREMPDIQRVLHAQQQMLEALVSRGKLTRAEADAQLERERTALEGRSGIRSLELLALYCLAKEPLALADTAAILDAYPLDVQRAFEIIRTVLIAASGGFALFHAGFRDYFLHLEAYTDTIDHIQNRLLLYGARWREHGGRYALRHYAEHLQDARRWDELFALARDQAFRQAQSDSFPEVPELPLLTVQVALSSAADTDNVARLAEFLLTHASQLLEITRKSPLDALRANNLEAAWILADLFAIERRVLWYLLMVWELKEAGRTRDARATLERLRQKKLPRLPDEQAKYAVAMLPHVLELCGDSLLQQQLLDDLAKQDLCEKLTAQDHGVTALRTALVIEDDTRRAQALHAIATAMVKAGEGDTALENTMPLNDTIGRIEMLQALVAAQVEANNLAAARETAARIDREPEQVKMLIRIAEAQARAGERQASSECFATAIEVASRIDEAGKREDWLQKLAEAQTKAGAFAAAMQTALGLIDEAKRVATLQAIAVTQAAARNFIAALQVAQSIEKKSARIETLLTIAESQAEAREISPAKETLAAALETANKIRDGKKQSKALWAIAVAQTKTGDFTMAVEIAMEIADTGPQVQALMAIAETQATAGDAEGARATFALTLRIGGGLYKEWVQWARLEALRAIAEAREKAARALDGGSHEEDKKQVAPDVLNERVARMKAAIESADTLSKRAVKQLKAGDLVAALEIAGNVQNRWEQAALFIALAEMQARIGKAEEARTILAMGIAHLSTRVDVAGARAEALRVIAAVLARRGDSETARATFTAAIDAAKAIPNEPERASQLWMIAFAQAEATEVELAKATATSALLCAPGDAGTQGTITFGTLAAKVAQASGIETARAILAAASELAEMIASQPARAEVLQRMALTQIGIGELTAALRTAERIEKKKEQAEVWQVVIAAYLQVADFSTAFELAKGMAWKGERINALQAIASAHLAAGGFAAALETARNIDDKIEQVEALRAIAMAQAAAGMTAAARASFALAIERVSEIDREWQRAERFHLIARSQADIGDFGPALETANEISDPLGRARTLGAIATAQAEAGDFAAALNIANTIAPSDQRVEAICSIAVSQASAQANEAASETLSSALDLARAATGKQKAEMLRRIAEAQSQVGELDAASETAKSIQDGLERVIALSALAANHARAGEAEVAQATFAMAMAAVKQLANKDEQARGLGAIALAQAKAGAITAAIETASQIINTEERAAMFRAITATQAEIAGAIVENLYGIEEEWKLAEAMASIAVVQAASNARESAQATFIAAIGIARRVEDDAPRVAALQRIALAQARAGEVEAAQDTFAAALQIARHMEGKKNGVEAFNNAWSIEAARNRIELLKMLSISQAQAGAIPTALEAAAEIDDKEEQAAALAAIVMAQTRAGHFDAAQEVAGRIDDADKRDDLLRLVAAAQAKAGFPAQAIRTMEAILTHRNQHIPELAAALVEIADTHHFKQLLLAGAHYLDAAYLLCGHLAQLYPEQSAAAAAIVSQSSNPQA